MSINACILQKNTDNCYTFDTLMYIMLLAAININLVFRVAGFDEDLVFMNGNIFSSVHLSDHALKLFVKGRPETTYTFVV